MEKMLKGGCAHRVTGAAGAVCVPVWRGGPPPAGTTASSTAASAWSASSPWLSGSGSIMPEGTSELLDCACAELLESQPHTPHLHATSGGKSGAHASGNPFTALKPCTYALALMSSQNSRFAWHTAREYTVRPYNQSSTEERMRNCALARHPDARHWGQCEAAAARPAGERPAQSRMATVAHHRSERQAAAKAAVHATAIAKLLPCGFCSRGGPPAGRSPARPTAPRAI